MEFGQVGNHCSFPLCNQQDFLPFQCATCEKTFCAIHRRPDDHKCSAENRGLLDDNYVIICPLCNTALRLKGTAASGATPAHVWNEHVETGECQMKQNAREARANGMDIEADRPTFCQCKGCRTRLGGANHYKCTKCMKSFCLKHRYEDVHDCQPVQESEAYQKIKNNLSLFSWGGSGSSSIKSSSNSENISIGKRIMNFFCCISTPSRGSDKAQDNKKKPNR